MNQLTSTQARRIGKAVAPRSVGFEEREDFARKVAGYTEADGLKLWDSIIHVAEIAAYLALVDAGCLVQDKARDVRRNEILSNAADANHQAWCKATGNSC